LSKGRIWAFNKGKKNNITIREDETAEAYGIFYGILVECLSEAHDMRPVHSLEEMLLLKEMFHEDVKLRNYLTRAITSGITGSS
jgi:hypothetical protein